MSWWDTKGTTFEIYLPRVHKEADVEEEATEPVLPHEGGSEVVLLVEDLHWADSASAEFLKALLVLADDVPVLLALLSAAILVLVTFGWLLQRTVRIAAGSSQNFGSILTFALFGAWFTHLVINVGMTVGLMPVTGLTLPFFSYGGSSLIHLFIIVALTIDPEGLPYPAVS